MRPDQREGTSNGGWVDLRRDPGGLDGFGVRNRTTRTTDLTTRGVSTLRVYE